MVKMNYNVLFCYAVAAKCLKWTVEHIISKEKEIIDLKGMPMPRPAEVHAVMVGQLSIF